MRLARQKLLRVEAPLAAPVVMAGVRTAAVWTIGAATLSTPLFWWSLAASLAVAFVAAVPVNHWLLERGKGHAVVHRFHETHAGHH